MNAPSDIAALRGARVLVTGAAGFIGHALSEALLAVGADVTGIDNLSQVYYARALKDRRLTTLSGRPRFSFREADLCDEVAIASIVSSFAPTHIAHLAAHASVLPSFDAPMRYLQSNILGTQVVLEQARRCKGLKHLVYASTSSVYGRAVNGEPFEESAQTVTPVSVYGASKLANEAMMQVYSDHYALPVTGLRFFKVYGPWGRPDTVFFRFVDRIYRGQPITLHNFGDISHSFTYVDDIVAGAVSALASPTETSSGQRHPVYNLGNPRSERLDRCVDLIELALGRRADRRLVPLPAGDRYFSRADIERARTDLGYGVNVPVEDGIPRFVAWYLAECEGRNYLIANESAASP